MGKVCDWIDKNRKATRFLVVGIPAVLILALPIPVALSMPGTLDNLKELHRQDAVRFYEFVVIPAVIAAICALAWERLGAALYLNEEPEAED